MQLTYTDKYLYIHTYLDTYIRTNYEVETKYFKWSLHSMMKNTKYISKLLKDIQSVIF